MKKKKFIPILIILAVSLLGCGKESNLKEPTVSKVRLTKTQTDMQESLYCIEADLEKVQSDDFGQGVHDKIDREWQEFLALTEEQRMISSRMYGHCTASFETWGEATEFLGIDIANPLEKIPDLTIADSVGIPLDSGNPDPQGGHVEISWSGMQDHSIPFAHVDAGYLDGQIRVVLSAKLYGGEEDEYTTECVWPESVSFENKTVTTKSGNTALVIVPKGTREYASLDAYVAEGNVLYCLHLVGGVLQEKEIEKTLEKVLEVF